MTEQVKNALDVLLIMQSLYECDLIETAPEWAQSLRHVIAALECALTQRPAAQTTRIWINHDLRDVSVHKQDEPGWVAFDVEVGTLPPQHPAQTEREAFEAWYAENAHNFEANPIGSRDCGLQWKAWQARASQPATTEPVQAERDQLRSAQADAVMPLIGPLLDAWENADREVMSQEPELSRQLKAINNAMEGAQPATTEPLTDEVVEQAVKAAIAKFGLERFARAFTYASEVGAVAEPSRDQIRDVFLANGFTVKEGQTDLKSYVYDAAYALIALVQQPTERKGEPVELPALDDESCAVLELFNRHLEVIGRGEWYAASTDLTDDTPSYRRATIKDAISMSRYWLPRLTKASEAMTNFLCAYEGTGADIGARRRAETLMHAANTSPQVPEDHPLMVFAIECEMGALQEHEVPLRARKALDAARKEPASTYPEVPPLRACRAPAEGVR